MKLKKGNRSKKLRGKRTHGFSGKKNRGKGNVGGKGMSGTGKRADQKKTYVLKYMYPYFGKQGFTSRGTKRKKNFVLNVGEIEMELNRLEKEGKARKGKEGKEVDLPDYKILGEGEIKEKLIIKAKSASKQAREKIEKAGGKVIVESKKKKVEEKKEASELAAK